MEAVPALLAHELAAILALLDCVNRCPHHFASGAPHRRSWLRWPLVAVATAWLLVGNGIVLGCHHTVIKRNTPTA